MSMQVLPEIQFQISLLNLVSMGAPEPQTEELEKMILEQTSASK